MAEGRDRELSSGATWVTGRRHFADRGVGSAGGTGLGLQEDKVPGAALFWGPKEPPAEDQGVCDLQPSEQREPLPALTPAQTG